MKKMMKLMLVLLMSLSAACGKKDDQIEIKTEANLETTETSETTAETTSNVVESSYGKAEGKIGNIMKTTNLEFTLNSARLVSSYQTITPDAGMNLLVLNITTHVLQKGEMKLYDTDYQVQWGGTGEEDYSTPVTYRDEWATAPTYKRSVNLNGIEGMFMGEAVLQPDESVTADYVYQVPQGFSDFTLQFQEFFEDESLGDRYIVNFTADMQE